MSGATLPGGRSRTPPAGMELGETHIAAVMALKSALACRVRIRGPHQAPDDFQLLGVPGAPNHHRSAHRMGFAPPLRKYFFVNIRGKREVETAVVHGMQMRKLPAALEGFTRAASQRLIQMKC